MLVEAYKRFLKVLIEKIGWVKNSELLPMDVKYTNPRIHFDGKYCYLSVGVEEENLQQKLTRESLGIHVGIKELAVKSKKLRLSERIYICDCGHEIDKDFNASLNVSRYQLAT